MQMVSAKGYKQNKVIQINIKIDVYNKRILSIILKNKFCIQFV